MGAALTAALAAALVHLQPTLAKRCEFYSSESYGDSVTAYRDGRFEEAARLMSAIDRLVVLRVHRDVRSRDQRSVFGSATRAAGMALPTPGQCRMAAALVHTELGTYYETEQQAETAAFHLEVAEAIARSQTLEFERQWRFYAALFYQRLAFATGSNDHLQIAANRLRDALLTFPNDAQLLVAEGALMEWSGGLEEALERYDRAGRIDPTNARANLRHGKVLQKLSRLSQSEAPLTRALELATDPIIIYRARMALGRSSEAKGRLDAAVAHYEAAIRLLPRWQVGYVALAHALHSGGARARSDAVLDDALALEVDDEGFHGWWSYELGLTDMAEPTLQTMRAGVSW